MASSFYEKRTERSRRKTQIVEKYFRAWSRIILRERAKRPDLDQRLAYVDLYAGPGRYGNGEPSTPLLVLGHATGDDGLRERLVTVFNDQDQRYVEALKASVASVPNIERLRHRPEFLSVPVQEDISAHLAHLAGVPRLSFLDPWGYKGLGPEVLEWALGEWGSDCLFFFNYNRVNQFVVADRERANMIALFGESGLERLRRTLRDLKPSEREQAIVAQLENSLREHGATYFHAFPFMSDTGVRPKHHLVFLSENATAYSIYKDVTGSVSSSSLQGVASQEHNPAAERQPPLPGLDTPLDDLKLHVLAMLRAGTMTVAEVCNQHVNSPMYTRGDYRRALLELEAEGRVRADRPMDQRPHGTMGPGVRVALRPSEDDDG